MINLADIDVEEKIDGVRVYSGDYVFCVRGKYLSSYDLQITRTTNIPFKYELYRVSVVSGAGSDDLANGWGIASDELNEMLNIANSTTGVAYSDEQIEIKAESLLSGYAIASYESQIDGNAYYYPYTTAVEAVDSANYKKCGLIVGAYKNDKRSDRETIALQKNDNGNYHERNYSIGNNATYDNVNQYVEPLYWQATELPRGDTNATGDFVDYYVLKVKWDASFTNTKETDMIYITARRNT